MEHGGKNGLSLSPKKCMNLLYIHVIIVESMQLLKEIIDGNNNIIYKGLSIVLRKRKVRDSWKLLWAFTRKKIEEPCYEKKMKYHEKGETPPRNQWGKVEWRKRRSNRIKNNGLINHAYKTYSLIVKDIAKEMPSTLGDCIIMMIRMKIALMTL